MPFRPLAVVVAAIVAGIVFPVADAAAFGFDDVDKRARELAGAAYKRSNNLPKELQSLQYDQYRDIRFKPDAQLWRGPKSPFEVAFFHQGWHFEDAVKVNEVSAEGVRELKYDPEQFTFGANKVDQKVLKGALGYAGFRVHFPVNTPKYKDEVVVFLGASYFRGVGKGQVYGLSARGLAVDTGAASGEEFPRFVEFWLERPGPNAKELVFYGLLDSRRMAGAYRFVLRPGVETALEVKARLYFREGVAKVGLAPLTSMFFYAENQPSAREDFRPEVHDSDGLQIHSGDGEWIWRPLLNPRRLLVNSFATVNPKGFGLMQRDRAFQHYEDLESRYERRPSAWIEPRGQWGAGRVELVQIPTPDETNDNIVAYWVPEQAPKVREPYDFEYKLGWQNDGETRPPLAWVSQTRRGRAFVRKPDDSISFIIDFEGGELKKLAGDAKLEAMVSADANVQIQEREAYPNDVTGGVRLSLRVKRIDAAKPAELRAYLRNANGNHTLSETWTYTLPPS